MVRMLGIMAADARHDSPAWQVSSRKNHFVLSVLHLCGRFDHVKRSLESLHPQSFDTGPPHSVCSVQLI